MQQLSQILFVFLLVGATLLPQNVSASLEDFVFVHRQYYPAGYSSDGDQSKPDL